MSQLKQADQQQLDKHLICSLSQCTDESLNPDVSEISQGDRLLTWREMKLEVLVKQHNQLTWFRVT